MNYDSIASLPITPFLTQICSTLKESPSRFLVLTAQTAAGKSTAVPLALLESFAGKILMLEPRRLAAVAIASRVAQLLGEEAGQTSGYTLHLESKISSKTRFEVCTEAILTRKIQADPLLEGINVVVLDEFHERSIHGDTALAFLKEAMALRDDLFVIVMSATIDANKIASYLSEPAAPVLQIPGRQFPVQIEYNEKLSPAKAILSCLKNSTPTEQFRTDTILCFLPGIYEINKTREELEKFLSQDYPELQAEILILHSSIPLAQQKNILSPVPATSLQRVILSSAIAETSLTVPGVTTVIDSGLARVNTINLSLGMEKLVTQRVSLFSADQRSGRAGRLMPGKCIRLWNKLDILNKENQPEILRTDLNSLVLECYLWGAKNPEALSWLDPPSKAAWNTSLELLTSLGLIEHNQITPEGKIALKLGISPRMACVAIYGKKTGHLQDAIDFIIKFSQYKDSGTKQKESFIQSIKSRLSQTELSAQELSFSTAGLLLAGYPDRLGKKQAFDSGSNSSGEKSIYQFPSGKQAVLNSHSAISPQWIIAPEMDAGEALGKIYSWEAIEQTQLEEWLEKHTSTREKIWFDEKNRQLKKSEITALGAIILKEKSLPCSTEDYAKAICQQLKGKGFSSLPSDNAIQSFLLRAIFVYTNSKGPDNNEMLLKLEALTEQGEQWLLPFINGTSLNPKIVYDALYWWLNGDFIEKEAPLIFTLNTGKKVKIRYENRVSGDKLTIDSLLTNVRSVIIEPVIEVIIQQIFGCLNTPKICGVPVLLKLLSPAQRPLQITDDLEHFWTGAWIEICKEMKGRYPKHNWDYRIAEKD